MDVLLTPCRDAGTIPAPPSTRRLSELLFVLNYRAAATAAADVVEVRHQYSAFLAVKRCSIEFTTGMEIEPTSLHSSRMNCINVQVGSVIINAEVVHCSHFVWFHLLVVLAFHAPKMQTSAQPKVVFASIYAGTKASVTL